MATEKRLIYLDEAIARIKDDGILGSGYSDDERIDDVCDMLECCHTVDAVEVIRCKDCKKWFRHTEVDRERGECRRYQTTKHETGYCDRGERKDNE